MFAGNRLLKVLRIKAGTASVFRYAAMFIYLSIICSTSFAGGLSTPLGEVVIENLQLGQSYNLTQLAGLKLLVTNTSEEAVNLQVDIMSPGEGELKYEAVSIPETDWVRVTQNQFELETKGTAATDIMLSIPNDLKYLGQKFQVMIWSHTMPGQDGGMFLAFGLKSRIIFSIANEVVTEPINELSGGRAMLQVSPSNIHASYLNLGQEIDLSEQIGEMVIITNTGSETAVGSLTSRAISTSLVELDANYDEPPSGSVLSFSDNRFELLPGESKEVRMYLELPENCDCQGGNYMFIIHASTENTEVVTGAYSRLYVAVE